RDPEVTDVLVNGPDDVWIERNGRLSRTEVRFRGAEDIRAAIERVIAPLGLRIDHASPAVDARLPDGSRLHAAIPPIAVDGPIMAVRRFTPAVADLDALVARGGASSEEAGLLRQAVVDRRSIVVSGGTGSGKTTLLNVLSREISSGERIVTVEDAAELRLEGHVVRLETRSANSEGIGQVTMRDLLRHALRLRPDRIVVGEVRGPEALDMIQAMSTGHDGSLSTVHANSPSEALWRLETLAMSGDHRAAEITVRRQLRAGVDLIVHMERRDGTRRVCGIEEVS
ncbi:MAG: CpaF family protein, partial [Acidimicrobiia bacterium]|nr:CpaF family protein [Acidimicrobiia bacterium]